MKDIFGIIPTLTEIRECEELDFRELERLVPIDMESNSKYVIGTKVVSAFPGTGKSYYTNGDYVPDGFASDSDSSKFDKSNFPNNYMDHIEEKIMQGYARIFVSSHEPVRKALVEREIPFTLVYPARELKEEYLERYKERGSPEAFINLLDKNWDEWITQLQQQEGCTHIVLEAGQFISNVV